jgi:hypothetical protein
MSSLHAHPYRQLFTLTSARTKRASSWDTTGGNRDFIQIGAGETATLLDVKGPGCITHFYWTMINADPFDLRDAVLRMYWDGEGDPSVEVPLGDFFGAAHCRVPDFTSLLLAINPGQAGSHGFNAYFPMPFASSARVTLEHQGPRPLGGVLGAYWYHIDYEQLDEAPGDDVGRFHAQWRRENLTQSVEPEKTNVQLWGGENLTGDENYLVLEAHGRGQLVGMHLQVDNVAGGWYGEGDDMIFIDGEQWPPSLHGTGSEEVFGGGACPDRAYAGPYTGYHLIENADGEPWAGYSAMYRWYIHDPVRFSQSIRMSLEHGHANNFESDYASVAYWYQTEPHGRFPELPGRAERLPRLPSRFNELREALAASSLEILRRATVGSDADPGEVFRRLGRAHEALYRGDADEAREASEWLKEQIPNE